MVALPAAGSLVGTSEPYHTPTPQKITSYSRRRSAGPLTAQGACHTLARCWVILPDAIISNAELRVSMSNRSLLSKWLASIACLLPACLLLVNFATAKLPHEGGKKSGSASK